MTRRYKLISLPAIFLILFAAKALAQAPVITSFNPASGPIGTLVTINGTGLSAPTNFTIGGVRAYVISNTGTELVAMVAPTSPNGVISLTTASGTATGPVNFTVINSLLPNIPQGSKMGADGIGSSLRRGGSVAISADGNTAIVGDKIGAWIYTRSGISWTKNASQLIGDNMTGSILAAAVSISADGNTAMIGGYNDDSERGAIWIFTRDASTNVWTQQGSKIVIAGAAVGAKFGWSVALSADGNTAVSGAIGEDSNKGAVYVFKRTGGIWSQQVRKASNVGGNYGYSVALRADGNRMFIGVPNSNSGTGSVVYFSRTGDTWGNNGTTISAPVSNAKFGTTISVNANAATLIIGGSENGVGGAWIYRDAGLYVAQGNKLVGTGTVGNANQGAAVSISADGNKVIVGGPLDNTSTTNNPGAVWMYTRDAQLAWSQQGNKLTDAEGAPDAQFGAAVALSADGNTMVVGGPKDNSEEGSVWFFAAVPPPTISSIIPARAKAGSTVTLTGTNFSGASSVSFGGTPASSFTVISPTSISAIVGSGSTGDAAVTTAGGTGSLAGFVLLAPPVIAYGGAQTYPVGTPISPLLPSSTGGSVPATIYGSISELGSGFASPQKVAVDASGNVYVADFGNSAIKRIAASDGTITSLGSGFSVPTGVAVDASGNVYVADYGNNTIKKIAAADGAVTVLLSDIIRPRNVAVDGLGNVYVADPENSSVKKIAASDGSVTSVGSDFNMPYGITIDVSGNIYVADWNYNKIKKIETNGTVTELGSDFGHPFDVQIDALGNVYVADNGDNTIKKIAVSDGVVSTLGSGFATPLGVAVDGLGNVYVADQSSSTIKKIATTGYTISLALPVGLSFDGTTGAISGTPSSASPAANYTVTAYNADGSSSAAISIAVGYSAPVTQPIGLVSTGTVPTGSTLNWTNGDGSSRAVFVAALETGSPVPANSTTYTGIAAFGTGTQIGSTGWYCVYNGSGSSVSITGLSPKTTYRIMVVEYNGTAGSEAYLTTAGDHNPVNVITTSINADLSALTLSSGTLAPDFTSATLEYTASAGHATTSITLSPTLADAAAAVTVNGVAVASSSASGAIALNVGANTITTVVTAPDGITTKTYKVSITRAPSANADLSAISLSSGTLAPVFAAATLGYTASVSPATTSITLSPTPADIAAAVTVNGVAVASGSASGAIALNVGANTITTVVTAPDGITTKTYIVVITRAASTDVDLAALTLSSGTLNPVFAPGTVNYTSYVDNPVNSISIHPRTRDAGATVKVNGTQVVSGSASGNIALSTGSNLISITVTSGDGSTSKPYSIKVIRLSAGQVLPNQSGDVSVTSTATQVVAASPTQPVSITVPPGTTGSPSIAYPGLVERGTGTLPQTVVNSSFARMTIPAATLVTASNPAWDGVLFTPTITTYSLPAIPGQITTTGLIIEVGSPDFPLSFDKAVRLQLTGQAGMRIARVHNNVYSEILLTGPEDSQTAGDALPHDGSFKINVGNDAVIWTKVFSKFIAFSQTTDLNVALVEADKAELNPDLIKAKNANLSSVTSPMLLPVSGSFGSAISWVSSNPAVVSANGQTIVRPVFGSGNINVTLTATISKGLITETKSFNVIVSQLPNQAPTLAAIAGVAICSTTEVQTLTLAGITGGPETGQTTGLSARSSKPAMFSELLINNGLLKYRLNPGATGTADITLTVKDNGGTADGGIDTLSRTFTLTVNALPASTISSDLGNQISKGLTAVLSVSPVTGSTYSWTNAAGIMAGQNTSSLSVRPALTTTYTLTITNSRGCVAVENYTITVIEDLKTLTINNLLTPNGDGTNDLLVIKNLDMYQGNLLKIFDRAGREVFRKVNYQNDWDGTYQGSPLAEGTYFYIVDFGPGKTMLKGYVSIVR